MRLSFRHIAWLALPLAAIMLGLATLAITQAPADAPTAEERRAEAERRSSLLTTEAPMRNLNAGRFLATRSDLTAELDEIKGRMPLPAGGSLDDVDLGAAASQGGAAAADLAFVAQHNAQCDWYQAVLDGDRSPSTLRVVSHIPKWSAFREQQSGDKAAEIAEALNRGDTGPLETAVTYNCRSSIPRG